MTLTCYVAGKSITSGRQLAVRNPYNGAPTGTVELASQQHTESAITAALAFRDAPTRYQRSQILDKARMLLEVRREEFARLITSEAGLCIRETRYEVGRALDVLRFAAMEALRDDGQIFSCDISPQGKARKIFTTREPLNCAVCITPFNHPLNQVAHKLAPAIAAGTPVILKPSEKTPLTAIKFVELLYEAGLPGPMLSVLLGPTDEVAVPLVRDSRVDIVSFTGSVAVGKRIAQTAGYKKLVLELGGNDPLIVLDDADLERAASLAVLGSYRNSGQRCTAVKRILVQRSIAPAFTELLVEKTRAWNYGDPFDPANEMGTVIDDAAARLFEARVGEALAQGARLLTGNVRRGALYSPTVLDNVDPSMTIVREETFGPVSPVMTFDTIDDAIRISNGTAFGLSSGVCTDSTAAVVRFVNELNVGTVNVWEVPGYRIELSPFGGVKDSGLGYKEGVQEAMKSFTNLKTFSLPWE